MSKRELGRIERDAYKVSRAAGDVRGRRVRRRSVAKRPVRREITRSILSKVCGR
jgi:hypothetical protein